MKQSFETDTVLFHLQDSANLLVRIWVRDPGVRSALSLTDEISMRLKFLLPGARGSMQGRCWYSTSSQFTNLRPLSLHQQKLFPISCIKLRTPLVRPAAWTVESVRSCLWILMRAFQMLTNHPWSMCVSLEYLQCLLISPSPTLQRLHS